jgi:hypothetical protein
VQASLSSQLTAEYTQPVDTGDGSQVSIVQAWRRRRGCRRARERIRDPRRIYRRCKARRRPPRNRRGSGARVRLAQPR